MKTELKLDLIGVSVGLRRERYRSGLALLESGLLSPRLRFLLSETRLPP